MKGELDTWRRSRPAFTKTKPARTEWYACWVWRGVAACRAWPAHARGVSRLVCASASAHRNETGARSHFGAHERAMRNLRKLRAKTPWGALVGSRPQLAGAQLHARDEGQGARCLPSPAACVMGTRRLRPVRPVVTRCHPQAQSTSKKHQDFLNKELMNVRVDEIPGVGRKYAQLLGQAGFPNNPHGTRKLLATYLVLPLPTSSHLLSPPSTLVRKFA